MIRTSIICRIFTRNTKVAQLSTLLKMGELLAGELPRKKHKLIVAWIEIHHEDLLADWELAVNGKKPFPIRGLDQLSLIKSFLKTITFCISLLIIINLDFLMSAPTWNLKYFLN